MDITVFEKIIEQICLTLERYSKHDPQRIASCKSGEAFERCVFQAAKETLANLRVSAKIHYLPGSHMFPDIILEFHDGSKCGIEVKSSSSPSSKSWKINGNSVLGSTKENVDDTYIIFGKTAMGNQAFRFKRYEESIANVAVTHSPRYFIDLDVAPQDTFFAKSGLSYKEISESGEPIDLITSYFKSQGQRAWWLSESAPAAVRMFSDIPDNEQKELIGYCFAHFPEIFSNSQKKFARCAMWLATEHSVVSSSLRDNFSAGGRVDFLKYGRVPRIFDTLKDSKQYVLSALNDASINELMEDWGLDHRPMRDNADKLIAWVAVAASNCGNISQNGYDSWALLFSIMEIE